jgi:UDP-N-acetylmuramoyl-tripeptide--D-alanyl-D-alanine ligase
MLAALLAMRELAAGGRCIAVLGLMAEQGQRSAAAHAELGKAAARLGVDHLLAVGGMARPVVEAARGAGLAQARHYADWERAAAAVKRLVLPGDLVLVKGSRVARLERVVEQLKSCL